MTTKYSLHAIIQHQLMRKVLLFLLCLVSPAARGDDVLQWSGFALGRGVASSLEAPPLEESRMGAQLQVGIDWRPSVNFGGHLHLLARDDDEGSRRGIAGIVEAYLEGSGELGDHRARVIAGAFFLPNSRENVDALWESPYSITSSALNSWMGEEFRPVGVDASYTFRREFMIGATLFSGNDTFGAIPPARGWTIRDKWGLLGEHIPVGRGDYTSVSAETDGDLGWSARTRWSGEHVMLQYTRIDNRSDAKRHGELLNWDTQLDVVAAELTFGEWSLIGEGSRGPTVVIPAVIPYREELDAHYVLASRRIGNFRATVRHDWFAIDREFETAITGALLWSPRGSWRHGVEVTVSEGETRLIVESRWYFGR